jgi:hypothetical protein
MMMINLQMIMTGVSIAFYSGLLFPIMVEQLSLDPNYSSYSETKYYSYALFGMVAFGIGEVVGAIIIGIIIDKIGS